MQAITRSVTIFILSGFFTYASAQTPLPPKVLADKYLVQAELLLEKKDYDGALSFVDKILALQKEHGFALRDGFHFKRARIAYEAGFIPTAVEAVSVYLASGNEGEFYEEALVLLIKAEEEMREVEIRPEETCAGMPERGGCWMALADRPKCYVWNPNPQDDESVTWSGGCAGNTARGEGTLTWAVAGEDGSKGASSSIGHLRKGRFHGHVVHRDSDGSESEGIYVDGKRQGNWVTRNSNGDVTHEGPYVDGVKHGIFVWRNIYMGRMIQGSKGRYVQGESVGRWLSFNGGRPGEQCSSANFQDGDQVTEWNYVSDSACDF